MTEPQTEAGRRLLDDLWSLIAGEWGAGSADTSGREYRAAILAIEQEAREKSYGYDYLEVVRQEARADLVRRIEEALEAEWYNGNIPEAVYLRLCAAAGVQPNPSASSVPTLEPPMQHGYTCGLCPWGRPGNRSLAEYVAHMNAEHPTGPLLEGDEPTVVIDFDLNNWPGAHE